tara:strand:+ start:3241 stop:4287 length:1047 start_codon:yes stop_codon:yes gene_type:complete
MNSFLKHFIILFIFIPSLGLTQSPSNDRCEDAISLCFNEWVDGNNYNATIDTCFNCSDWVENIGCFELNNSVWFNFKTNSIGGFASVHLKNIQFSNISDSSFSNQIQASILKADTICNSNSYEFVSICELGIDNDFSFSTVQLEPFQTYYVLIDGGTSRNGQTGLKAAECGFEIKVNGNGVNPEVSAGNDVYLEYGASVELSGTGNGIATWFPSDNLSNSNVLNPIFSGLNNTELELTINEDNGCQYVDNVSVYVEKVLEIPNAITINNDGFNDFWIIENIESYPISNVSVYDRWGQQVYNAIGYTNSIPWDGKRNNSYLPSGTYFYIIDTKSKITQKTYSGSISIIK